jgi:hypothetical protein
MYFAVVAIDRSGITDASARTCPAPHFAAQDSSLKTMAGCNAGRLLLPE